MPINKRTKIVATLGPATSTKAVLKGMLDAGVNVFRVNFSHANYDDVTERIEMIRELNEDTLQLFLPISRVPNLGLE